MVKITLQEEAEHVEQEEDAHAVEVGEESFVVDDRQLMGAHITDHIRNADDDKQHCVHQTGDDKQRSPAERRTKVFKGNKILKSYFYQILFGDFTRDW